MYNFILNCWELQKITEDDVNKFVSKGYITENQAVSIMNTEKSI